jgi:hypothetical protein
MAVVFASIVAAGLCAGAVAAAASESGSLRVLGASSFAREVALEAAPVDGADLVVLEQDGVAVATRTVGAVPVRFDAVPVASDSCTFTARYLNAGGDPVAESAPVPVEAADFVPCAPILNLKDHLVVGPSPVLRGVQCSETTTLVVLVNGSPVAAESVRPVRGAFALETTGLPYQESAVAVRAINAWGSSDSASFGVFNLGQVLARSTYIVVDRSECRLYFVKNGVFVKRYSISVGTPRTPTPTGEFVITKKRKNTHPKLSGLGAYWLRLEKVTSTGLKFHGYFIHGTSWKGAIGLPGSLGCVDMLDSQISKFGPTVPVKTHVLIRE